MNSNIVICGVLLFWDFCFHLSSFLSSLDAFYLSVPENYHYLNQSGCIADKTISDKDSFKEVIVSCFPSSLHFKNAGGAGALGHTDRAGDKAFLCLPVLSAILALCAALSEEPSLQGLKFSRNASLSF